jgi:hypothetical protein
MEYDPQVAMDAPGNFVVAWTVDYSATDKDVEAARFTANGQRIGSIFDVVNSGKNESEPSVAMAADGRIAVAYQKELGYNNADIYRARYTAAGGFLGNLVMDTSSQLDQFPSVAMDNAGNAVVAYGSDTAGNLSIHARRVSSSGVLGPELLLANSANYENQPAVALDPTQGNFVVAYSEFEGNTPFVWLREVGANDKVGSAQLLGSVALDPAVSFGGFHTFLVTYTVAPSVIFNRFGSPIQISRPINLPIDLGDLGHRLRSF